jgi:hypothetical protein
MFFRILTRAFWVLYDNLFKCMLLNIILFLSSFGLFALFMMKLHNEYLTAGSIMLLWHIAGPAYMHYMGKISRTIEHGNMFVEIGEGLKLFALRGIAVFAINTVFIYVGIMAVNFYRTIQGQQVVMLILGGIGIWIILIFMFMQIYLLPVMVMDEKRRIFTSYKKALIMTMSAPFSTSTTGFFIGFLMLMLYPMMGFAFGAHIPTPLALLALFPIFMMPFLSLIFIIIMQLNAAIMSYEKHNIYPLLKEFWEERKLGNIFRPWEHK